MNKVNTLKFLIYVFFIVLCRYEKSYMHRDVVTHVAVSSADFFITGSVDGKTISKTHIFSCLFKLRATLFSRIGFWFMFYH